MTASDDTDFEWWHIVEELNRVLDNLRARLLAHSWRAAHIRWVLLFFFVWAFLISLFLILLLQQEGLFIENKVIEDGSEEDAFEHHQIPHHFTRQEDVLQLLVRDKVVEPLLSETWHTAHFEKVWRLESGQIAACSTHTSSIFYLLLREWHHLFGVDGLPTSRMIRTMRLVSHLHRPRLWIVTATLSMRKQRESDKIETVPYCFVCSRRACGEIWQSLRFPVPTSCSMTGLRSDHVR